MKIIFIRHGLTSGNMEGRYIGSTDEPLCPDGIVALRELSCPDSGIVVCSPMKRCIQTADILYPNAKKVICDDFRECDFGDFEGRNYRELSGNEYYQTWIDSGGNLPFPNGESPEDFRSRTVAAFESIMSRYAHCDTLAFVVHGGTIMAVMDRFSFPHRDYFDWHIKNGELLTCEFDGSNITLTEQL
ncbi:MAG TPA: histidine phosphatase family protein [Ruminococcus flavefaciens]|nr:histidine phosphatase family protein [Ruminococcus flavefaciens]